MTVVVGTAGHIDHGKTTLLRALTGIDADRLPEERRRGMTIDIGYAHLTLDDGTVIDFVDVPGHDRLVGNMLVGAGEIDAAMLVVAADDGPRAQTLEHLGLLDALSIGPGVVVVTKVDAVEPERIVSVVAAITDLLAPTSLAGSPVVAASGLTGHGLAAIRTALAGLAARVAAANGGVVAPTRPGAVAIDRVFAVKGRGTVVTGTLRGGPISRGDTLRVVPGDRTVRVREVQVHGLSVERADGGRTALNIAGATADEVHRGDVLTADPTIQATSRALATFGSAIADRAHARFHAGTAATEAQVGRSGRDALVLPDGTTAGVVRLASPVALASGDRFVLRRGAGLHPIGGTILDVHPPRGVSRRRQTPDRVGALAAAVAAGGHAAVATRDLHGAADGRLADDVREIGLATVMEAVVADAALTAVRATVSRSIRRVVSLRRDEAVAAAAGLIDELVADGRLVRDGDRLRLPGSPASRVDPVLAAAMDRLEAVLAVPAPPSLSAAAQAVGCPPAGVRSLERAGRIVVLEPELAYAMSTYRDLAARALAMATRAPLTPAAFRDATGTSRRYVMAILEDLDRRGILRRTPSGHLPGPKAPIATAP